MSAQVINMARYLFENNDDSKDAIAAVKRASMRPLMMPDDANSMTDDQIGKYLAFWLIEGLWLEGYRVVRIEDDDYE